MLKNSSSLLTKRAIQYFLQTPKKLFLLDGLGAILSAFFLAVILVAFDWIFGIPIPTLYFLAAIPCFFALFDIICYITVKTNFGIYLKTIAILNIAYCLLSLLVAFLHREQILALGWAYILGEIAIVATIAWVEWKVGDEL